VKYKLGLDRRWRSSNYSAVLYLFSADQVYAYRHTFSLLENEKQESTTEVFYGDVESVSTSPGYFNPLLGFIGANDIKKDQKMSSLLSIGLFLFAFPLWVLVHWGSFLQRKFGSINIVKVETVTLGLSSGDSIGITIFDMRTAERSISGLRSLFRNKKQELQDNKFKYT